MIINGIEWHIKYVKGNNPILINPNGIYTLGVTVYADKTIYISKSISGLLLKRVVAHEICHCFVFSYGLKWDRRDEERLCDFVSVYAEDIINNMQEIVGENYRNSIENYL